MKSTLLTLLFLPSAFCSPVDREVLFRPLPAAQAQENKDFAHTYSCYCGRERHCGQCATCRERRDSFAAAGLPDPTDYERESHANLTY